MTATAPAGRREIAGRSLRWNVARAAAAYAHGWWVRTTLVDALREAAAHTPDRVVLIDETRSLTCAALLAESEAMAAALLARAAPGDVVSFMLPNWSEAGVIYLAAAMAGMVIHPILPTLRQHELRHMLPEARCRLLFIPAHFRDHDYIAMLETCDLPQAPEIVVLRGDARDHTPYADLLTGQQETQLPALEPDAAQMLLYTSGTTGASKGVIHSHNSLHALARQLEDYWRIGPDDLFLIPSPISHIGGSIYAFECPLLLGTTAVLMEKWDADEAVALMLRHGCTHMAGATPFLEQLLEAAARAGTGLPDLRLFICGGAAVPPALIRRAAEQLDKAVVTRVYGSTEIPVTTVGVLDPHDIDHAATTDGKPGIATIKLAPHAAAMAEGEGEIFARGPQMLVGYVDPADEEGLFDAEGFFRTGDLGRWVDRHFLSISGRAKDIIIRKGENISPREVEEALAEHPDIRDVAIVGLPDPARGEKVCAVIVPHEGTAPDQATLSAFLAGRGLAAFKWPEQVVFRDTLPRNAAGKILKQNICAALSAALEEA